MISFRNKSAGETAGKTAKIQQGASVSASRPHSKGGTAAEKGTETANARYVKAVYGRLCVSIASQGRKVAVTAVDAHAAAVAAIVIATAAISGDVYAESAVALAKKRVARHSSFNRSRECSLGGLDAAVLVATVRGLGGCLSPTRFYAFCAAAILLPVASSAAYMSDVACHHSIGNFTRNAYASGAHNCVATSLSQCKFLSQRRPQSHQRVLTFTTTVHTLPSLKSAVVLLQVKRKVFLSYTPLNCNDKSNINRIRFRNHSRNSSFIRSHTQPAGNCTGRYVFMRANSVNSDLMSTPFLRSCSLAFHTARTRVLRKLRTVQNVTQTTGDAAEEAATLRCNDEDAAKNPAVIAAISRKETAHDFLWDATAAPRPVTAATMARQDVAPAADRRSAATMFSPPFPRAVPLAYEILEPAEHQQNMKQKIRQQLGRGLPLSCSKKRSACSRDAALETKVNAGVETDMDQTGPSPATVGKGEEMRHGETYREESSAYPLVVVLHGMFRCRDNMKALCVRLNAEKVVAADLRNHGDSPFTRTMFLQDMAADVLLLLQHLRERFPSVSRCILVGHSLGGQVAMAAAIRSWYANATAAAQQHMHDPETHKAQSTAADDRPSVYVEGVAALDICPVNYYRWPLPSGGEGQQNVRDLVELVGRLDLGELEEQLHQQRQLQQQRKRQQSTNTEDSDWGAALNTQPDTSWRNCCSRSLLTLLVEAKVEEAHVTALGRHKTAACSERQRGTATQPQILSQQSMLNMGGTEAMQHQEEESWQTNGQRGIPAQTSTSSAKRRLRWRMNVQALRDAFRSETLKWDIPLPVEHSSFAATATSLAGPAGLDRSSPTDVPTTTVAGKAAPATLADDDSEAAMKFLEKEYDSVAGFKEAPPAAACDSDRPLLLLRGGCSPWVDVDRHWKDIIAFFPSAKLQTIPRASHAVHDDQLDITAAAINSLLQSKMKEVAEQ